MNEQFIIHVLRNYAPSSLNRGEDGSPKSAQFGGTWRGRISSQSLKRAIRRSVPFEQFSDEGLLGLRTRQLPTLIAGELFRLGWSADDVDGVIKQLSVIGKSAEKAEKKAEKIAGSTNQMIMIPSNAPLKIAEQINKLRGNAKFNQELENLITPVDMMAVDTALFGAMTTSAIFPDVRAACQVSHALGVNVQMRMTDFFVAVDDITLDSGMMGGSRDKDKGDGNFFSSNCFYWTVGVNLKILLENLKGDSALVKRVLAALIEAIATSHPSGKQNTFATHPFCDLILIEKRKGQIFDYANAFVNPVEPTDERSLTEEAMIALGEYMGRLDAGYEAPVYSAYFSLLDQTVRGTRFVNIFSLIKDVMENATS